MVLVTPTGVEYTSTMITNASLTLIQISKLKMDCKKVYFFEGQEGIPGESGIQGQQGLPGRPGIFNYAYLYTTSISSFIAGQNIPFSNFITSSDFAINSSGIKINITGTFLATYYLSVATTSLMQFNLAYNNKTIPDSFYDNNFQGATSNASHVVGSVIFQVINPGFLLQFISTTNSTIQPAISGSITASLKLLQIA